MKQLPKKPQFNQVLRYSNMAFQMILIILAGSLGGRYADHHVKTGFPVFTLVGVLVSVFAALYLAVKDFLKK